MSAGVQAAVVEIVERRKKPEPGSRAWGIVVPNEVRINGQKILTPADCPVTVHDMSPNDVVKVTLTVYARRVFIGHEDIDESITDAVADAKTALLDAQRAAMTAQATAVEAVAAAQAALHGAHQQLLEATRD